MINDSANKYQNIMLCYNLLLFCMFKHLAPSFDYVTIEEEEVADPRPQKADAHSVISPFLVGKRRIL
jgi:hypothetical protein